MGTLGSAARYLWVVIAVARVVLLVLLLVKKNYKVYPFFFAYLLADSLQGLLLAYVYWKFGYDSLPAWRTAWDSLWVVIMARTLAVAEVCYHFFGKYRGIWGLIWRVLVGVGLMVLVYSILASGYDLLLFLLLLRRCVELALAAVLLTLFLFSRYYKVEPSSADKILGLGFMLISCIYILNTTILQKWLYIYAPVWTWLEMLTFFASLLMWTWALRQPQEVKSEPPELLPDNVYLELVPEVNVRLRALNRQLEQFWNIKETRP